MTSINRPTHELAKSGQSPWLDYISRDLIRTGKLKSLIHDSGILGVTSNPSIFEKAINQSASGYEKDIQKLLRTGATTFEIYDELTVSDIQAACDLFRPVFDNSKGEHGFVSLEVIPGLAYYEDDTVAEAERLFKKVNRPNVMIKVPATPEGIPAVQRLIAKGININITLMFSLKHYRDVANAYIEGLEALEKSGGDIRKVHSVASVFVSRIDTLIDKQLPMIAKDTVDTARKREIEELLGKAAVANSKLIYQEFKTLFGSERWQRLQRKGAWIQKVLWGSTSVKNPAYPDLKYVEDIIGRETVNTMPQATLEAFLDHGRTLPNSVESGMREALTAIEKLNDYGFDLNAVGDRLQKEGAKLFCDSFDSLMHSLEIIRMKHQRKKPGVHSKLKISRDLAQRESLLEDIGDLGRARAHERFLQKDPSLWKEDPQHQKVIANRLGWLQSADWTLSRLYELDLLAHQIRKEGYKNVVLLGMGGSSLAPEVLYKMLGKGKKGLLKLFVLDTTDPGTILKTSAAIDLKKTLIIVSSKSGTTSETISQFRYFYTQLSKRIKGKGVEHVKAMGRHFIAVTDDGSYLEAEGRERYFRRVFINPSDIGGRFSALSYFGMAPAVLSGIAVRDLLYDAHDFYRETQLGSELEKNPGMYLGILLGQLAREGHNKVHLWSSEDLSPFTDWLEQLIAECTGKEGKGIIPVIHEQPGLPEEYRQGSVFLSLFTKGNRPVKQTKLLQQLSKKGFPVLEMEWAKPEAIGAEFLKWEIAVSFACLALEINPFDEPNVKESKDLAGKLLNDLKKGAKPALPAGAAVKAQGRKAAVALDGFLAKQTKMEYIALLAYTENTALSHGLLQKIQSKLRKKFRVPVLYGFGPRYLHSIGQLYKGGPKTGVFVEFLNQDSQDATVPETHFRFSQLKRCQALGDLHALRDKSREILAIELGKSWIPALTALEKGL